MVSHRALRDHRGLKGGKIFAGAGCLRNGGQAFLIAEVGGRIRRLRRLHGLGEWGRTGVRGRRTEDSRAEDERVGEAEGDRKN
jgi:hypothetical protein